MLRIAVANPFDPLPGEPVPPARYASLCRVLAGRGHEVHWFSSDFSHLFKRPRDVEALTAAARQGGYRLTLAPTRPYHTNISPARLLSHRLLTRRLRRTWSSEGLRYDVVLASLPTSGIAMAAAELAHRCNSQLVLDVQDLWPETFERFWPPSLRWANRVAFAPLASQVRRAYRRADALVGVADGYIDHAKPYLRPNVPTAMIPLGVDLDAFDRFRRPLDQLGLDRPGSQVWLFVSGSLGRYVWVEAIVALMSELHRRDPQRYRVNIVGSGDAEKDLRQAVSGLPNVRMHGRVSEELFASLATASDVALLPIRPDAQVFLPNRVFQYFAAGLPILSTIPGQLQRLLAEHQAGITCDGDNASAMADAVDELARRRRATPLSASRPGWVGQFDRWTIANRFADFLESAAR